MILVKSRINNKSLMEGGGGHGNTSRLGSFLGDACIIVAPDGYERRW